MTTDNHRPSRLRSLVVAAIAGLALGAGGVLPLSAPIAHAADDYSLWEDCDWDGYDDHTGVKVPWPGFDGTKGDTPAGPSETSQTGKKQAAAEEKKEAAASASASASASTSAAAAASTKAAAKPKAKATPTAAAKATTSASVKPAKQSAAAKPARSASAEPVAATSEPTESPTVQAGVLAASDAAGDAVAAGATQPPAPVQIPWTAGLGVLGGLAAISAVALGATSLARRRTAG